MEFFYSEKALPSHIILKESLPQVCGTGRSEFISEGKYRTTGAGMGINKRKLKRFKRANLNSNGTHACRRHEVASRHLKFN
ncbi:hypothetical protein SAMN06265379_101479 [Saccharicrinis carchari]|uniref:Uncharacterized protein n=1 Tax=Saccharicrinis carchari TaxID=1168039 RepID=A0A521AWM1_SACCC|nr:hypothetical protein SAMN06265379_101479 [Saccharicrinis carchari]